jgi:hypothetical protein
MAEPLLPYGVDRVAWNGPGAIVSAQQAIAGAADHATSAPASGGAALALPRCRTKPAQGAGKGADFRIRGSGEPARRNSSTITLAR